MEGFPLRLLAAVVVIYVLFISFVVYVFDYSIDINEDDGQYFGILVGNGDAITFCDVLHVGL